MDLLDLANALAVVAAVLWVASLMARGHLVARHEIEQTLRERDEWREATRLSEQQVEELAYQRERLLALHSNGDPRRDTPRYGSDHGYVKVLAGDLNALRQRNHAIYAGEQAIASSITSEARAKAVRHGTGVKPWTCPHEEAVDVHTVATLDHPEGELVARWCPACSTQLPPSDPEPQETPPTT